MIDQGMDWSKRLMKSWDEQCHDTSGYGYSDIHDPRVSYVISISSHS